MELQDCLDCGRARLICSFLGLPGWEQLRRATRCVSAELSDGLLRCAAGDVVAHVAETLAGVREPSREHFDGVATALLLVRIEAPCHEDLSREFEKIVDSVLSWCGKQGLRFMCEEERRTYLKGQILLRDLDPTLWKDAVESCPRLYAKLCNVVAKCQTSWQDRDRLVEAGAAQLPSRAPLGDPLKVRAGLRLATLLSCGSFERVAELEKGEGGAKLAKSAMQEYPDDMQIAIAALAYLSNLSMCGEMQCRLIELKVGLECLAAMERWPGRSPIQDNGGRVLEAIVRHRRIVWHRERASRVERRAEQSRR